MCVTGPDLHEDTSFDFLDAVMADRAGVPCTFESLPTSLGLLAQPLPITPHEYNALSSGPVDHQLLAQLAVSTPIVGTMPASVCTMVSNAVLNHHSSDNWSGELAVKWDVYEIVTRPMMNALKTLGVDYYGAGDNAKSSGATSARQRPNVLLFFRDVVMFKVCLRCCHRQHDWECLLGTVIWKPKTLLLP